MEMKVKEIGDYIIRINLLKLLLEPVLNDEKIMVCFGEQIHQIISCLMMAFLLIGPIIMTHPFSPFHNRIPIRVFFFLNLRYANLPPASDNAYFFLIFIFQSTRHEVRG